MSRLRAEHLSLGYDAAEIVDDLSVTIPDGKITTIIGPNGCGKSTLLRALVRLLKPRGGSVLLDGQSIHHLPTRDVARRLGLLAQQATPPGGLTVADLVQRGRYPHQGFLQPPSQTDAAAVDRALALANMSALRDRPVDSLSGGQRQRAWIAMTLAQETPILLLDEPTTYLDLAHQLEVTELVRRLNRDEGRTVVMVLHDINEAARTSDRIIAMKDGRILAEGTPAEIVVPELLHDLYGIACDVHAHPASGELYCMPRSGRPAATGWRPCANCPGFGVKRVCSGYGGTAVLKDVSVELPAGQLTVIVGPNACGKSTLLRTCGRLLDPMSGEVTLGDDPIHRGSHRALARKLALLAQGAIAPPGFVVEDLIALGRLPHQHFLHRWRKEDETTVVAAIGRTNLANLRFRDLETLSGGQRQRAWIALALAQDTPVLLLDEPTTFLDLAAQIALLDLARGLNRREGRGIVMILHDLNLAARYADQIVMMKAGEIVAVGPPAEVITRDALRQVFEVEADILTDPRTGTPVVVPLRVIGQLLGPEPACETASLAVATA
ncbi:MAG: ABC transporter ATP-binding protein [Chloroflexota bacterium]|nr:ABC transporter ATP-binding protein [Chloroflexota bacterium]